MENSFFEFRDKTGADSGSDSEIINDSLVLQSVPYSVTKKNRTAFVAESDESSNDEDTKECNTTENVLKSTARSSSVAEGRTICSSEDDGSRRGSLKNPSESHNNVVLSSSDEDEDYSPELVPKRPPPRHKTNNPNESLVLLKTKKRMLFQDSDTDNSIIIERNKNNKLKCLKDTPLKIEAKSTANVDKSMDYESCDGDDDDSEEESDDDDDEEESNDDDNDVSDLRTDIKHKCKKLVISSDESGDENETNKNHSNYKLSSKSKKLTIETESSDESDDDAVKHKVSTDKKPKKLMISSDESDQDEAITKVLKKSGLSIDSHKSDHDYCSNSSGSQMTDDDDDGPDEDMMVMSRATRMSIMGIIPKDNDSDDSDFIQSDSSSRKTAESGADNLEDTQNLNAPENFKASEKTSDDDLPEVTIHESIEKSTDDNYKQSNNDEISIHSNDSKMTCSPFSSPLQDITNKSMEKTAPTRKSKVLNTNKVTDYMDLTVFDDAKVQVSGGVIDLSNLQPKGVKNKMLDESASVLSRKIEPGHDDDVTIIDSKPEIIALSSDDEDEVKPDKNARAPSKPKSPTNAARQGPQESMKQYLAPSRAGHVVYVQKHVKENELNKLMRLKEDLNSVRALLDEMDLESLPDGGSRLRARHAALEGEVRRQGDRVANMVLEPAAPTAADIARDGFDAGLSWDDIQKASNAVQPRMFGKQAMATHMAERHLILERLRELHASLGSRPEESSLAAAPRLLASTLMPYQRHALAWLQWRETQKPASGILADDMGLGKTISMIALIASDKQATIDYNDADGDSDSRHKLVRGGTLVVCPASLLQQWASEVRKHCGARALSVCLHHGAARAAQPHRLAVHDMVATTYNILQRDSDKNGVLMRIAWRRIILDEAHIVRNHKSATSLAVAALRGARRWCLTGTPVQNKDLDLFALLKFLRLSPFDDLQMWKKWIDNKSEGGQERLNIIMQCILLRRTKALLQEKGQLACLPPRTAHTRLVTLSSDEMNVYQKVLVLSKTLFAQFLHQRAEKNSGGSFTAPGKGSEYDKMHKKMIALQGVKPVKSHEILVLLLRLRQVCCHCGLVGSMLDQGAPGAEPEPAGADLLRELDKLSLEDSRRKSAEPEPGEEPAGAEATAKADEAIRAVLAPNHPVFRLARPSAKIAAVMDCLNQNVFSTRSEKAVVVSQWTSVLSLVEKELSKQQVRSVTLSGAVAVAARPRLIDTINDPKSDVRVMLLSLCAGGVGINLCGANHLLLLDPHWNPQLEQQAQDRIYRVGQDKPVHIYRFVCVDTVEQTICKLQEAKLQLADNVLTGAGNKSGSPLSVEELKMMFNMGS